MTPVGASGCCPARCVTAPKSPSTATTSRLSLWPSNAPAVTSQAWCDAGTAGRTRRMNQSALREDDARGGGREDDEGVKEAWRDGERKEEERG